MKKLLLVVTLCSFTTYADFVFSLSAKKNICKEIILERDYEEANISLCTKGKFIVDDYAKKPNGSYHVIFSYIGKVHKSQKANAEQCSGLLILSGKGNKKIEVTDVDCL